MFNSLTISIGIFLIAAFIIAVVGIKMTKIADRLADKTGLGEALVGAFLLLYSDFCTDAKFRVCTSDFDPTRSLLLLSRIDINRSG